MIETVKLGPAQVRSASKISHPQIIVIPPNMFLSNGGNSKNMIVVSSSSNTDGSINASNNNIVRNIISLANARASGSGGSSGGLQKVTTRLGYNKF